MILVDTNLILDKWKGDVHDKELVALIPFLECISPSCQSLMLDLASQNFDDFRPILKEYKESAAKRNITIPEEFARREALAREVIPHSYKTDCNRHFKRPLNPLPQHPPVRPSSLDFLDYDLFPQFKQPLLPKGKL